MDDPHVRAVTLVVPVIKPSGRQFAPFESVPVSVPRRQGVSEGVNLRRLHMLFRPSMHAQLPVRAPRSVAVAPQLAVKVVAVIRDKQTPLERTCPVQTGADDYANLR